jgi:hypothetical protein
MNPVSAPRRDGGDKERGKDGDGEDKEKRIERRKSDQ